MGSMSASGICAENYWESRCFLSLSLSFFFKDFIYLFMRDREREGRQAETQEEGEAGSMQGDRRGTRSQVSRIRPWTEGGTKPLSHQGCPVLGIFNSLLQLAICATKLICSVKAIAFLVFNFAHNSHNK